jgi:hypothetical protein
MRFGARRQRAGVAGIGDVLVVCGSGAGGFDDG